MHSLTDWRLRSQVTSWYRWLIFASVVSGTFMSNVDSSIMNVALPVLERGFHVGPSVLQWVVSAYLLVITGILPIVGSLSDRMNRKTFFIWGVSLFTLGSILCTFSASIEQLIAFRVIQSLGGAVIMGNVMSIVVHIFPAGQRGKPLGLVGSVVAAGTIVGPSLGGILITWFGWRSIFWVNVPIGILAVLTTSIVLMDIPAKTTAKRFDGWGAAYFFVAVCNLLLYVSEGQTWGWTSWSSWSTLSISLLGWFLFVRRELRTASPLIELSLFTSPAFSLGNLAGYLSYIMMMFPGFILPLYMHHVLHIPTAHIGLLLTPQAISMIVFSPLGGFLADKYGTTWPPFTGMILATVGLWLMSQLNATSSYTYIILALSLFGLGIGLFTSPNNVSVLESVPPEKTGLTGSLIATVRFFGRVSGVAIAVLLLQISGANLQTSAGFARASSYAFFGSIAVGLLGTLLNLGKFLTRRNNIASAHEDEASNATRQTRR